ncbi:RHS repeat-associated core domain-containing protein [Aquabacterium sp.]|uniref:RHS repeat-associated core domain-containing protein n=1 Tax=Aquabacterium sp. TaxID=1872578 RepID=UPI002486E626|nr:RHS repeat-associated core domain-containing protein [Aquabacterium sp.]MDI1257915.1 transglutaminase domain-containing protein [Aquabacterium sp.]
MQQRYLARFVGSALASALLQMNGLPALAAHRDVAPIPAEVIEAVVNRPASPKAVLADQVSQLLWQMSSVLDRHVTPPKSTLSPEQLRSYLQTARADLQSQQLMLTSLRSVVQQSFHDKVKSSLALRELDQLNRFLSSGAKAEKLTELVQASSAAQALVKRYQVKNGEGVADPLVLPATPTISGATETFLATPLVQADRPPAYAQYSQDGYPVLALAAAGGAAILLPTPSEASFCSYNAGDLAKTQEEVNTTKYPELADLAKSLDYNPVKIFDYVNKNIRYQSNYSGSLKGAYGAYLSKAGNDYDHASLLIALLRASNVPARYVFGQIEVVDPQPMGADGQINRWLSVKDYPAAARANLAGLQNEVLKNAGGQAIGVKTLHVWVQACLPYASYRGVKLTNRGHRWLPLDPSYKDKVHQPGIQHNVAFDLNAYLAKRTNGPDSLPHEKYLKDIESAITTSNPGASLADVPYKATVQGSTFDVLPASLPYKVSQFVTFVGGAADVATLPDAQRNVLKVVIKNSAGTSILAEKSVPMVEAIFKRMTVSFKGIDATHQGRIDAWRNTSTMDSPEPSCTAADMTRVVPSIKADGVELAAGAVGSPVDFCAKNVKMDMFVSLPVMACTVNSVSTTEGCINKASFSNIEAPNIYALLASGFHASDAFLQKRIARLQAAIKASALAPNSNVEEIEGEFLNVVAQKYGRYLSDTAAKIGQNSGHLAGEGTHLGVTTSKSKISYVFDQPFAITRKGFLVDVPGGRVGYFNLTTGVSNNDLFFLAGRSMSALESYIWQENAKVDAVSTLRGLQFANETGNTVLKLTSANWATDSAQLTYTAAEKVPLKAEVDAGATLYIPKSKITYENWVGTVYISENPTKGSGLYAISGGYSGGYSLSNPISYNYSSLLNTGYNYYTPPIAPVSFNSIVQSYTPPPVVNSYINYGSSLGNTYSGDPVNMVTGNMYHNETDVDLTVRGGQRLVFQRAYNSRKGTDGPLGFGWTHSFNQFITFRDDNVNGTTDAPDTDGLTSSVTWTEGTGSEKYMAVTAGASAAGLAATSTFKTPDGYYFTFKKNADNTYTLSDKGGVSYTFESMAGTKDQRANLVNIKDRNGNTITLNYDGSKRLSTVTDGSRTLTLSYDGTSTRIKDVTDPLSRKHSFAYDASGNLIKVWKPGLNVASDTPTVAYEYYTTADGPNLDHAMKRYTLARGNYMNFVYYPNGRVLSHTNSKGESMSFSYNDFRRETVQVNERGHERRFFFDKNGMPLKTVEENLASREFTYGGADTAQRFNLAESVDPRGARLKYSYESATGNLLTTTYASGRIQGRSNYNTFSQPGKIKDVRGLYTLLKYDARGNVLETIQLKSGFGATTDPTTYAPSATDAVAQIAAWTINTYDSYGNLLTSKKVRDMATKVGPSVEYGYEATNTYRNKITRRGDKNGDGTIATDEFDTATLVPDAVGQTKTGVDGRWSTVTYAYDDQGRVKSVTNAANVTSRIEYDGNGNVKLEKLEATVAGAVRQLQVTANEYDDADRKVRVMANGLTASFEYDAAGNLTTQTDPDGRTLSYTYDEMNRMVAAQDKEGNRVAKTLDIDGRPLAVTDPNGLTVNYSYWDASRDFRLKRVIQPKAAGFANARAVEYDYDEVGNVKSTKVIPADGSAARETLSTYDELSRPTRVVGPLVNDPVNGNIRRVTKYTYDNLGGLTQVNAGRTDATGTNAASDNVTLQASYTYDDFGRKLKDKDGVGRTWAYTYSTAGDVLTVTDPRAKVTTNTWNTDGTLKTRSNEVGTVTFTRDVLGLPTKVVNTNPVYTQDFTYNGQRRLESVRDSRGNKTLYYEYSPAGQLNAMRDSEGAETNYLYDRAGRLSGLWAANYDYLTFAYDKGGRLSEKWSPNGVKAEYTYNDDGSLQGIRHVVAGAEKAKHSYLYDAWGNRKEHAENLAGSELKYGYEYDELNRLIKAQYSQSVGGTPTTNLIGQYRYDILNNRTRQTDKDGNYLNYVYDNVNGVPTNVGAHQLNQIDLYNLAGVKQSTQATLNYDAAGNLTSKTAGNTVQVLNWDANNDLRQVVSQVSTVAGGTTTVTAYNEIYNYDHEGRRTVRQMQTGNTLYQSQYLYNGQDIHKEYALQWLTPVAAYTHGPAEDDPLIHQSSAGNKYYHADGLGSPTLLTDVAGNVQAYKRFDPWGKVIGTGGAMPTYGYTGREPDLSTGYMYYRARYYDPTLGRFLGRDPIGLEGGLNVYAYVDNNPVNFTDPSGLYAKSISNTMSGIGSAASNYYDTASSSLNSWGQQAYSALPSSQTATRWLDNTQKTLDYVGMFAQGPLEVAGPFIDLGNAAISLGRGNWADAGLSTLAAVPFIGATGNIAKMSKGADFYRGAKSGELPSFVPRPNDFKVDSRTGFVKDSHGVSVFDNAASVSSKGFVPHRVDQSSVPDSLRIIQRGADPHHFEISPMPGANLTPQQFINACSSIVCRK